MPVYKDSKRGTWYVKYSFTDRVTGKRKQVLKQGITDSKKPLFMGAFDTLNLSTDKTVSIHKLP